jgi:hypothetical protein
VVLVERIKEYKEVIKRIGHTFFKEKSLNKYNIAHVGWQVSASPTTEVS